MAWESDLVKAEVVVNSKASNSTCLIKFLFFFSQKIFTKDVKCVLKTFQKQLDGYKFPVYSAEFCPRNDTEWHERASVLNCTMDNGYTCLPNSNFTELLEFCYTQPQILIEEGNLNKQPIFIVN